MEKKEQLPRKGDSHGQILGSCPIFYPLTGTEIMNVHFREDGFVEIAVEGIEESGKLAMQIISEEEYFDLFSKQPK
jgi:hypothetical protein